MNNPVLVEVMRGDRVESVHRGAIAVCDADGRIRLAIGDVDAAVYPRSSLKPVQAIPLIESGAAAHYSLGSEELALACASHSGEPQHTTRVSAWQGKIGCSVADLACGAHRPMHEATANEMVSRGEKWTPLHNNCSGKHTGFMTVARALGVPVAGYERPDHPVQRLVEWTFSEVSGVPGPLPYGIDGCTVPNFAVPMRALALAMARIADPDKLAPRRAEACRRIFSAMTEHPELVAGTGRACTRLMRQSPAVAVKTGAEGVYVAILPSLGLGAALKVDDGAGRAAETAIAALLIALGAIADDGAAQDLAHAPVLDTRGRSVGERRFVAPIEA
ncbi:MAG: asparaginase [Alphaproteobacteria bacterium]|nr:asparaginase [Alphaproteobacteria bacterium]